MTPIELRTVTICLSLPPAGCSPNEVGHRHWRRRSCATAEYRGEAFYAVRALCELPMRTPVLLLAAFCVRRKVGDGRYRPRDVQNAIASLKGAVDGLVDAGLIPDDSARHLRWGETTITREGRPGVVLVLTEEAR